jgi:hypothetical protein
MFNVIKNLFEKPKMIASGIVEYNWRYPFSSIFHDATLTVMFFEKNDKRSYKVIDSEKEYSTASDLVKGACEIWVNGGSLPSYAKMIEKV